MGFTARHAERRSVLRNAHLHRVKETVKTTESMCIGVAPCDGEIVDFIVAQHTTGAAGTDQSYQLVKNRLAVATDVLSTQAKITLAAGAGASVDARKTIAAVAGCVRPVLSSTLATRRVKKGDVLSITPTENGNYAGTWPTIAASVVIAADF